VRNWEPAVALFSGHDGLAATSRLVRQAASHLEPGGLLALEVDARRASLVVELVASDARYTEVSMHLDLAGRERFVLALRRELE
jgi:release factor glutamine methyltransferase